VVKLVLRICEIDSIGTRRVTPLAAAISLKDSEMMKLLKEHAMLDHLAGKNHVGSALRAASAAGDMELSFHLVNLGGEFTQ
jgi:hypothetical protein